MDKLLSIKLNRVLAVLVLATCLVVGVLLVGCTDEGKDGDSTPCSAHTFERVEDAGNRAPTYDADGRELRKCTHCDVTAYFVLPKLVKADGTLSPEYIAILDSYVVSYGDTLSVVASKYFTSGWAFTLDGETEVGEASEVGYDFAVRFTPSDSTYGVVEKTVKLVVKKAVLTEADINLIDPINIPSSVNSLEEMPLALSENQEIKGTIAWVSGQEILRNQSAYYNYVFTPEDSDNYEVFVGKILLNG
ncbi:MAG: hypothetical protein IJ033_02650 [Clostridia bacterium]|nr:hypothetical protein [Clostridia bacterium]